MKQLIGNNASESYSFTPGGAGAGTVTISGVQNLTIEQILLINNVTRDTIIYNPFVAGKGYSSFTTPSPTTLTITLEGSTSGYSSGDKLQIFYDNTNQQETVLADMSLSIKNLVNTLVRPMWYDNKGNLNVNISGVGGTQGTLNAVTTINTVQTVTSLSQLAGVDAKFAVIDPLMRISFAENIRRLIT